MRALCLAMLVLSAAAPALAQSPPTQRGFVPVEQRVDDLDPLARSQRLLNPGLGLEPRDTFVFRKPNDRDKLYYLRPGINAEYDNRSEYYRLYDKHDKTLAILNMIPPNTLFHIDPPRADDAAQPVRPDPPQLIRARIDGHATGPDRADAVLVAGPQPMSLPAWNKLRQAQTRAVADAIDRVVAQP